MTHKHVLIYGESHDGKLSSITPQVMAGGRSLADELSEELHVVLIGYHIEESAHAAFAFGADKVYAIDSPRLARYECGLFLAALAAVVTQHKPRYVLFGHTDTGAELGPRLSVRLNTAIATDCVALSVGEAETLMATKPVYGGLAMALYAGTAFPQMATVRPKSMAPLDRVERQGLTIPVTVDLDAPARVALVEQFTERSEGINLEDAEVIIAGGRGVGGPEGFEELQGLATLLSGAVGASRVACDNGWISTTAQVGITGNIVAPKLYIAIGISGASQHMSGCSKSRKIVAINKDESAAIFKYAHFGVVGDWKDVLPAFIRKLRSFQ